MDFKGLFNKGKDILEEGIKAATKKVNDYKDAKDKFNGIVNNGVRLSGFTENNNNNKYLTEFRELNIAQLCLSLNDEEVKVIDGLVPIKETIIEASTFKEVTSNNTFALVLTNEQIYIIDDSKYKTMKYEEVKKFDIIVKDILSTSVDFNGIGIVVSADEKHTTSIKNALLDKTTRDNLVSAKTKYLCGKVAKEQYINSYGTGVTVTEDNMLILHNVNTDNKLVSFDDIDKTDLLLDTSIIYTKGEASQNILSVKHDCRKMTVRVTFNSGSSYILEVLPTNTLNTLVRSEDATFIKSNDFARKIMDVITRNK